MVDNVDFSIQCNMCWDSSGSSIYIDTHIGELVCKKCGLVLENFIWLDDEIYAR
jgi:transcription initiation factor TFIIIB Brf1 subunit/transcription initiation factor TFIIB